MLTVKELKPLFTNWQDITNAPSSPSAGAAPQEPPSNLDGVPPASQSQTAYQQQWAPEEESEEEEEENVGQWSPEPLDARHVGSQDVIHEDDDMRMLALLRSQVVLQLACCCSYPVHGFGSLFDEQ